MLKKRWMINREVIFDSFRLRVNDMKIEEIEYLAPNETLQHITMEGEVRLNSEIAFRITGPKQLVEDLRRMREESVGRIIRFYFDREMRLYFNIHTSLILYLKYNW